MKKLSSLLLLFPCLSCFGGGYLEKSPDDVSPSAYKATVTGMNYWPNIEEVPSKYKRIGDTPIAGPYYILLSNNQFCAVSEYVWYRTRTNDLRGCRWHYPQGT